MRECLKFNLVVDSCDACNGGRVVLFALENDFTSCNYNKHPNFGEVRPGSFKFPAHWVAMYQMLLHS